MYIYKRVPLKCAKRTDDACCAGDQGHGQHSLGAEGQERAVGGIDQVCVGDGGEVAQWRYQAEHGYVLVAAVLVRGVVRGELVVHRANHHNYHYQANRTVMPSPRRTAISFATCTQIAEHR